MASATNMDVCRAGGRSRRRDLAPDFATHVVVDKFELTAGVPVRLQRRRPPTSGPEAAGRTALVGVVVAESRGRELRERAALPRFTAHRNPHNSVSIRHHL